jgi:hypothetical protein
MEKFKLAVAQGCWEILCTQERLPSWQGTLLI